MTYTPSPGAVEAFKRAWDGADAEGVCAVCGRSTPCPTEQAVWARIEAGKEEA